MIAHSPICRLCEVEYAVDYEGPCTEPGCSGKVSWEATADQLALELQQAADAMALARIELDTAIGLLGKVSEQNIRQCLRSARAIIAIEAR